MKERAQPCKNRLKCLSHTTSRFLDQPRLSVLPGIEAVVVTLTDDSPVAEFHEAREPRSQRLTCRELTRCRLDRACPHDLQDHLLVAGDGVKQLVFLRAQKGFATRARFGHRLTVASGAVRHQ